MEAETWLEMAERLRGELGRVQRAKLETDDRAIVERMTIALWLRSEFSEEKSAEVLPFSNHPR